MKLLFIFLINLVFVFGYAHNTQEAYFEINKTTDALIVSADFPWTVRNALLKAYPELEYETNQEVFDQGFYNYVKTNLILTNSNLEPIPLLSVNKIIDDQSSHHIKYNFVFKNLEYTQVSNTLLFNINKKQSNIHQILMNEESLHYITTSSSPSFEIPSQKNKIQFWKVLSITIGLGCLFLLLIIRLHKKHQTR